MCLSVKRFAFKRKAKKDIVCYKVLCECNNQYKSLYQGFIYQKGKRYETKLGSKKKNDTRKGLGVYEGFHSYKNKGDTKYEIFGRFRICMRCIIPKGSYYYKGKFGDYKSYVSESIIIDEVAIKTLNL